jgi:hypothetical protein
MANWAYFDLNATKANIRETALNTVHSIVNDSDKTAEMKIAGISAVLDMVADIDEQIALEKKQADSK